MVFIATPYHSQELPDGEYLADWQHYWIKRGNNYTWSVDDGPLNRCQCLVRIRDGQATVDSSEIRP
jgi:hypothetical protein